MKNPKERLQKAMSYAIANKPKVGGFPFLAECLYMAGVERNIWTLPGSQSIYIMKDDIFVQQGTPLVSEMTEVFTFDEHALVKALRADQAGQSTFPEFLIASWKAGVVGYEVDFLERKVTYTGARGEKYTESYPPIEVRGLSF